MATTEASSTLASDAQSTTSPTRIRTAATPTVAAVTPTTRRRAKSFLRNYYGIQQTNPANQDGPKENASTQPGSVSKADPYDLDSHAFEVDKYMHKMFVEKQLPGLVQADNELVADIRQLDGDMKTLVYENYSKFLSATDTINKMKSNVDNLESEMSRLTQNIGNIAISSSTIHSSLGAKREKIRQLNGVHNLLTKLQFVFELPTNLHQCLETGSYTQAVRSYCRTLHLLQHYKHLTVFIGIERECKAIMVQIAQRIRQKMCADRATVTEISECVGLLLALKEDPVALQKQYLDLSLKHLSKVNVRALEDIKSLPLYVPPAVATESSSASKSSQIPSQATTSKRASKRMSSRIFSANDITGAVGEGTLKDKEIRRSKSLSLLISGPPPTDKVSYLNLHYLRQVEGFVVSFKNYFLAVPVPAHTPPGNSSSSGTSGTGSGVGTGAGVKATSTSSEDLTSVEQRPPAWTGKDSRVFANLTKEQQDDAVAEVKEAVSMIVNKYLATVSSFLDYPDDIFSVRPEVHIHVLQNLYLATLSCNGLCQLVGFDALVAGQIQNWEKQLIRRALETVKLRFMDKVVKQDDGLVINEDDHSERLLDATLGAGGGEEGGELTSGMTASNTCSTEGSGLTALLKETTGWLHQVFKTDTIPFLEKCMSSEAAQFLETKEGRKLFLKNFQDGFKTFWDEVLKQMQQTSLSSSLKPCSRTLSLIMSQLCFKLSNTIVEQIYRTLSKTLFRPGKRGRSNSFLIESYEEPPMVPQLQWDCKAVIQSCQETGHTLLDSFIARTANELSWIVMDVPSTMDYMAMASPPLGVSETWEDIYKQLNDIERQVILVYGDDGDRMGNRELSSESIRRESPFRTSGHGHGGGGGNGSNHGQGHRSRLSSFGSNTMNNSRFFETQQRNLLLSNIDKLFSDRVEIFIRCQDLNRTGIMFGIIKILLKAWAESVRTKTFGKGGFQQVQVDAEFAKVWLWRFVTADERLMHSLLEETQQTAFKRCIDPAPLPPQTVDMLIHSER